MVVRENKEFYHHSALMVHVRFHIHPGPLELNFKVNSGELLFLAYYIFRYFLRQETKKKKP
jgi:hypothetical protein